MTANAYLDAMVKVAAAIPGKALMSTFGGKAGDTLLAANHSGFMGHLTGANADASLQHTIVKHVEANKGKFTRAAGMEGQVDTHMKAMEGMTGEGKLMYLKSKGIDHTGYEQSLRHQTNYRLGAGAGAAGLALAATSGGRN
jgi:hypothetical protein